LLNASLKPVFQKHRGRRVIARLGWSAALIYMGIIFYLSSLPGEQLPLPHFYLSDKVFHFLAYLGLGILIALRTGLTDLALGKPAQAWTKPGWIGPAVGIIYGLFDEVHQLFTPHRTFDLKDWVMDIVGVLLGFWLARVWDKRRQAVQLGIKN
jgi:VanZ family protein